MSPEPDQPLAYEERIATCPIHQWIDVDDYLKRAGIPDINSLWEAFHELVLARGQYPKYMSGEHGKKFDKEAVALTKEHELQPIEAGVLKDISGQLTGTVDC